MIENTGCGVRLRDADGAPILWGHGPGGSGRPRATEEPLRARIDLEHARRDKPWKVFKPGRWYEAAWQDDSRSQVVLRDGKASAAWPCHEVEIRQAADDAWEIRAPSRMDVALEGQMVQIPGRIAECPEGHSRTIPTRFDADVVVLTCRPCGRAYRLVAG